MSERHGVLWFPGLFRTDTDDESSGTPEVELLGTYVQQLSSDYPSVRLQGATMLRKLWCGRTPSLNATEGNELVQRLANVLLQEAAFPQLQHELAWTLGNAAALVSFFHVDAGVALVEQLRRVLNSRCRDLRALAVAQIAAWAIGNLSKACDATRNQFLSLGAFDTLVALLRVDGALDGAREGLAENVTWALSRMCISKPPNGSLQLLLTAVPVLLPILATTPPLLIRNAATALFLISNSSSEAVCELVSLGVLPLLIRLLPYPDAEVQLQVLQSLANFVSHDDSSVSAVIDAGALSHFRYLLAHPDSRIRQQVCFALSNICAGTREQLQAVIHARLIEPLLLQLSDSVFEVRKEALWAIANAVNDGTHVAHAVEAGILDVLSEHCLGPDEPKELLLSALECIESILSFVEADDVNLYARALTQNGGRLKLEALSSHSTKRIQMAVDAVLTLMGSS